MERDLGSSVSQEETEIGGEYWGAGEISIRGDLCETMMSLFVSVPTCVSPKHAAGFEVFRLGLMKAGANKASRAL